MTYPRKNKAPIRRPPLANHGAFRVRRIKKPCSGNDAPFAPNAQLGGCVNPTKAACGIISLKINPTVVQQAKTVNL